MTTCTQCGGTRLPSSQSGAVRGTCHCKRRGKVVGRRYYGTSKNPVVWHFRVEWEGRFVAQTFGALAAAEEFLEALRAGTVEPQYA